MCLSIKEQLTNKSLELQRALESERAARAGLEAGAASLREALRAEEAQVSNYGSSTPVDWGHLNQRGAGGYAGGPVARPRRLAAGCAGAHHRTVGVVTR